MHAYAAVERRHEDTRKNDTNEDMKKHNDAEAGAEYRTRHSVMKRKKLREAVWVMDAATAIRTFVGQPFTWGARKPW